MNYEEWLEKIIFGVEFHMETTRSDAQAVVEAAAFTLSQCWGRNESAEATVHIIMHGGY